MDKTFMTQKRIILLLILALFIFLLITLMLLGGRKVGTLFFPFSPTPTPIGGTRVLPKINTTNSINVTSVDPEDGATNIPINQTIHITFSRPIDANEVTFIANPPFQFTASVADNVLTIKPSANLSQYTVYSYFVTFLSFLPSKTFTFTTSSPNPSITPFVGDTARNHSDQNNKITLPDLFLANQCPYTTKDFTIDAIDTPYPKDHFFFNVTLNKYNPAAKQAFIDWLHSLTLSDEQIGKLEIHYY